MEALCLTQSVGVASRLIPSRLIDQFYLFIVMGAFIDICVWEYILLRDDMILVFFDLVYY